MPIRNSLFKIVAATSLAVATVASGIEVVLTPTGPGFRNHEAAAQAVGCTYSGDAGDWTDASQTALVSGNGSSNGISYEASISADGTEVGYTSYGTNLVGGDSNGVADAFATDVGSGSATRLSVGNGGQQAQGAAGFGSYFPSLSSDGSEAAFYSYSPNLAGGDANTSAVFGGTDGRVALPANAINVPVVSVEAWFRTTGSGPILGYANTSVPTTPYSHMPVLWVGTDGKLRGEFWQGSISPMTTAAAVNDGKWHHAALVSAGDVQALYLDGSIVGLLFGTVSHPWGVYATVGMSYNTPVNGVPVWPGMPTTTGWKSFSGRIDEVAVYRSALTPQAVSGHFAARTSGYAGAVAASSPWAHWRLGEPTGSTTAVNAITPAIRAASYLGNVVPGQGYSYPGGNGALTVDDNDASDIFVRNRDAGTTTRVSVGASGAQADGHSTWAALAADGDSVAFISDATNLVAGDTNGLTDLFVRRDLHGSPVTVTASVTHDGSGANGISTPGRLSGDGRWVVFSSAASNLLDPALGADTNGYNDIFIRDLDAGPEAIARVSVANDGTQANADSYVPDVSADGRFVVFYSYATNLDPGDDNGVGDVFIHDRWSGHTTRVSPTLAGQTAGLSYYPRVSADGRFVVFNAEKALLASDTNGFADVMVWERETNRLGIVSRHSDGTQANADSGTYPASVDGTGSRVSFDSEATSLVGNQANGSVRDVFAVYRGSLPAEPTAPPAGPASSDRLGLEQFFPLASQPLGTGTAYTHLGTGNLVAVFEDEVVPAVGLNAVVRATYNSRRVADVGLGSGWSLSVSDAGSGVDSLLSGLAGLGASVGDLDLTRALDLTAQTVEGVLGLALTFTDADGTTHRFVRPGPPCTPWTSPPGVDLKVRDVLDGSGTNVEAYEFVRPDGVVYRAEAVTVGPGLPTWRITNVTDRRGNSLEYGYVTPGLGVLPPVLSPVRVGTVTHQPSGEILVRFEWQGPLGDRLERIVTLPDTDARTTELAYQPDGRLQSITEDPGTAAEAQTTLAYHPMPLLGLGAGPEAGRLASVTDARGNTTSFSYGGDDAGMPRVQSITDRAGEVWAFSYAEGDSDDGQVTTLTSPPTPHAPAGAPTRYTTTAYGPLPDGRIGGGNIAEILDAGHSGAPGGVATTYEWEANRLHLSTDGLGNERRTYYDEMGLVRRITQPSPNDPARADLPPGAPTVAIDTTFDYSYPVGFSYDGCTDPTHDTAAVISAAGRCHLAAELTSMTQAANISGQSRLTEYAYDGAGNMTSMTRRGDAANPDRTTNLTWDSSGLLATVDGPLPGTVDVATYGIDGQPLRGYHRSGQPTSITDAASQVTTRTYTPRGSEATVIDRDGRSSSFEHDAAGRMTASIGPGGAQADFTHDPNGNLITTVSPEGLSTTRSYDARDAQDGVSGPGPVSTSTTYHPDGTTASETTAAGGVHSFEYWPNRALRRITDPPTGGGRDVVTDYSYDGTGRMVTTTGPEANDAGDRPVETVSYTPAGSVANRSSTSAAGPPSVVRYAYDAHGAQIEALGPRTDAGAAERVAQSYNPFGQVATGSRRLVEAGTPRDLLTRYDYDLGTNRLVISQPAAAGGQLATTYSFDPLGRLTSRTDPGDSRHLTTYAYDNEGNQVAKVESVDGTPVRTIATSHNPDTTVAAVVATDLTTAETLAACNYAPGADPATGHDDDGRLLYTRSVSGTSGCEGGTTIASVTELAYDSQGLLASATQGVRNPLDGTFVTRAQAFTSAPNGQPASVTHDGATTSYAYEASGSERLGAITDWRGIATAITYQPGGGIDTLSTGTTASLGVERHPDGSPSAMSWTRQSDGAVLRAHSSIAYDPGGFSTSESVSVVQPAGSSASSGGTASYGYDLAGRLATWTSPYGGPTTDYTLDDGGNVTVEDAAITTTMTYVDGRLTSVTEGSDPPRTVHHDALGQEIDPTAGTITYDPMGQTATRDGVSYTYDARGRLVARFEGTTAILYFHLGLGRTLAEEANGAGEALARYLRDPGGSALASESWETPGSGSSKWTWLLADPGGNVATRIDDAGAVISQTAYQPWGEPDPAGSAADPGAGASSLGFGGALTDHASGLVALGGRLYDPSVASFTTPDSFLDGGADLVLGADPLTGSRYVFAASNPVAYFDNGHCFLGRDVKVQKIVGSEIVSIWKWIERPVSSSNPEGGFWHESISSQPIYDEKEVCIRSGFLGELIDYGTNNDIRARDTDPSYSNRFANAHRSVAEGLESAFVRAPAAAASWAADNVATCKDTAFTRAVSGLSIFPPIGEGGTHKEWGASGASWLVLVVGYAAGNYEALGAPALSGASAAAVKGGTRLSVAVSAAASTYDLTRRAFC